MTDTTVYAELGLPKPDIESHLYALAATMAQHLPDGAVPPPATEVIPRALSTISHWYQRQVPSARTAATAYELVRILSHEYPRFWDAMFGVFSEGSPIRDAAFNAGALGARFDTIADVDEALADLP